MSRTSTCIVCPNGCSLEASLDEAGTLAVTGAKCKRGKEYARQEMTDPRRTIASSVVISGGDLPLCSVRLTKPISKKQIFDVMDAIRAVRLKAPARIGDVVIRDVCATGSDVMVTKNIRNV